MTLMAMSIHSLIRTTAIILTARRSVMSCGPSAFSTRPITPTVSMAGWKLRDLSGKTWALDSIGTLQPGQQKSIKRNGQAMAMNNNGDTIELLNPSGLVIQTVTYQKVKKEKSLLRRTDEIDIGAIISGSAGSRRTI